MSITLGNYYVETKKTVGDLPIGSDNIIATQPCEGGIDPASVQPKWKKIHEYTFLSDPTTLGHISSQIGDDDVYQNGFDYKFVIDNIIISGSGSPVFSRFNFTYNTNSFDINGYPLGWLFPMTIGAEFIMNEGNMGGSYANAGRYVDIESQSGLLYSVEIYFSVYQLVPATIEIELCGGGSTTNITVLDEEYIYIPIWTSEFEERVLAKFRKTNYIPDEQIMPSSCNSYKIYFQSFIPSSPNTLQVDKSFFIDEGAYETKILVSNPLPIQMDYKLYDGTSNYLVLQSDVSGLVDWTDLITPLPTTNLSLQVWNGLNQELTYGTSLINLRYDLREDNCPCECSEDCGGINVIFNQNCGTSYGLRFNLSIQDGKYTVEGESVTQGGQLIKPITKTKATYDFVITDYSDETYQLLMELISDNLNIDVVDNIDPLYPNTRYYIDTESLDVGWNFNSKLGSLTIPVIKESSMKTKRRNCCN